MEGHNRKWYARAQPCLARSARDTEPYRPREPTLPPLPQHPTFGAPTACEWASCSWSSATLKSSSSTGNPAVQKSLSTSSLSPPGKLLRKEKGRTQAPPQLLAFSCWLQPLPSPASCPVACATSRPGCGYKQPGCCGTTRHRNLPAQNPVNAETNSISSVPDHSSSWAIKSVQGKIPRRAVL